MKSFQKKITVTFLIGILMIFSCSGCVRNDLSKKNKAEIVNVSYDPTRELYKDYNKLFTKYWHDKTGQELEVIQSHGGSGKQALEVANGLGADVVTLALEADIDGIADEGLIDKGFVNEFAHDSAPYTSTIVFLVRKGNPKNILDWNDLIKKDVDIITPNPKTSGGARWNYLAAWYYFEKQGLSNKEIESKMTSLYKNVLVLDSGARGAATTFVENGQGDVLVAWENEAFLSLAESPDEYEIVVPSASILCQPTVAVVDEVVDSRGSRKIATEYLKYLYSKKAQKLEAKNYYRPSDEKVLSEYEFDSKDNIISEIPKDGKWIIKNVDLTNIDYFGGWKKAVAKHFSNGGLFDKIYEKK